MKIAIITGASSGLGLGFASILSKEGYKVYAGARSTEDVPEIENVTFVQLDVTSDESISNFISSIDDTKIDLLINNAGVNKDTATNNHMEQVSHLDDLDRGSLNKMFSVNSVSPLMLIKATYQLMNPESFIINISSNRASFNDENESLYANYGYRASKTALNMITQALSHDLPENINYFCIHPGSIKTNMNPGGADSPDVGAQRIFDITKNWDKDKNGKFLRNNGEEYPI